MSYPSIFHSIFARNCKVEKISSELARAFMENNHRYGYSRCKYKYGLFISRKGGGVLDKSGSEAYPVGTLVAVACFSNARKWNKGEREVLSYEWVRYASLEGTRVQGGMGKMLDAFIDEVHPDDVMSYAPLHDGNEGGVYELLGFRSEGEKEFAGGRSMKYRLKINDY